MSRPLPAGPKALNFQIGDVCNAECIMCWQAIRRATTPRAEWHKEMPAAMVLDVVRGHLDTVQSVELVSFGEPMINPEFAQMVHGIESLATERGAPIRLQLITNGSLLHRHYEPIMRMPGDLTISIDAPYKELYERIRPGLEWDRLVYSVREAVRYQHRVPERLVGVNFTVFEDNVHTVESMGAFCMGNGIDYLAILHGAALGGTWAAGREIKRDDPRLLEQLATIRRRFPHLRLNDYATGAHSAPARAPEPAVRVLCERPWIQYDVGPDGHAHPCCRSFGTDLGHYTAGAWMGEGLTTLRAQMLADDVDPVRFGECARCEYLGARVRPVHSLPVVT